MIKYAIDNGYKYYNLYEIGDITDSNNNIVPSACEYLIQLVRTA